MKIHLKFKIYNLKFLLLKKFFEVLKKHFKNSTCQQREQSIGASGFTLIEMVIVIAMIGIISSATFKLVKFSDIYKNLKLTSAEVKGMVRTAQTLALSPPIIKIDPGISNSANRIVCGFGVRNVGNDIARPIEIFYSYSKNDDPEDCRIIGSLNQVCLVSDRGCDSYPYDAKYLGGDDSGVTVSDSSDNPVLIFFRSPYGKVIGADSGYTIKITQTSTNNSKEVVINKFGRITSQ